MADEPTNGPDEAALAVAARHALHDEELIAALADADLDPADRTKAEALVARCSMCTALHADLLAITAVVKASGTSAEVAAVRFAPRDFRLTPERAGIARPASPIERLTSAFAAAFGGFSRPLGVSFVALGLVGVLVGSANLGSAGGALTMVEAPRTEAAPAGDPGAPTGPPDSVGGQFGPLATDTTKDETTPDATGSAAREAAVASTILIIGSAALLVAGLLLIAAARQARAPATR